jgi:hypothetical protein
MKNNTLLLAFSLYTLGIAGCGSNQNTIDPSGTSVADTPHSEARKKTALVIICDLTGSIHLGDSTAVPEHVISILSDNWPQGSEVILLPLESDPQHRPLLKDMIPETPAENSENSTVDQIKRHNDLYDEKEYFLDTVYNLVEQSRIRLLELHKDDDDRSCIINSLSNAEFVLRRFNSAEYNKQIVLISDLIEDCSKSILTGQHCELKKNNISPLKVKVESWENPFRLPGIKTSVIVLPSPYHTKMDYPSVFEYEDFYHAVLNKLNAEGANNEFLSEWQPQN